MNRLIRCLTLILLVSLLAPFFPATTTSHVSAAPAAQSGAPSDGVIGEPFSLAGGPVGALMYSGCTRVDIAAINDAYEQRVVELVNEHRALPDHNLPPLKRVTDFGYAARFHAADMANEDYFNHYSFDRDGSGALVQVCDPGTRIKNFVTFPTTNYSLGENIAAGQTSPESVMASWIGSSGHHANIVNSGYREIGVGFYTNDSSYYHRYWVQDFGKRTYTVYPIVINREAATTTSPQVSLYIYGEGVWNEMRLRSDDGAWTSWMAFQKDYPWTLPCTSGQHTVSVELRMTGQPTAGATASDSITLQFNPSSVLSLGNLPASVTFLYGQNNHQLAPLSYALQPLNSASTQAATWTVNKTGFAPDWLNLSVTSGTIPDGLFTAAPSGSSSVLNTVGTYTGTLTINAVSTNAQCPVSDTATINVRLVVVAEIKKGYLPALVK